MRELLGLVLIILSTSSCSNIYRAYQANEQGREDFSAKDFQKATSSFVMAKAYHIYEEIATFNLANTAVSQGNYAKAHKLFEDAILLSDKFYEAHFNDGHALFSWGNKEKDSKSCKFAKTFKLWGLAIERFETASQKSLLKDDAIKNIMTIKMLKKRLKKNCKKKNLRKNPQKQPKNKPSKTSQDPKTSPNGSNPKSGTKNKQQAPSTSQNVKTALKRIKRRARTTWHRQSKAQQLKTKAKGQGKANNSKGKGKGGTKLWW